MLKVIDAAFDKSRTILMAGILLIVGGMQAYLTIPKEAEPDITIPIIYISIIHEGISPEDSERLLVRPMENELRSLSGVKEMSAVAAEGHASIQLEFEAGFDSKDALADVRDRVTLAKAELPSETEEPTIHEVTLSEVNPALTIMLSGSQSQLVLSRIAKKLRDEIESLESVLEVDIAGLREDVLQIIIQPEALLTYGLTLEEVVGLVSRNNQLVPAGLVDTGKGRFALKIPGVLKKLDDFLNLPVKVASDSVVRLRDIAIPERTFKDPTSLARLNGLPALAIEVKKRPGENLISTVENVKAILAQAEPLLPDGVQFTITGDQSENIERMLKDLQNSVLTSILLVVIVIVAFLGPRTATLVGVAIPGSFLAAFLVLSMVGMSVNIVVLFSLIMAVGMLVDGAIVVTEFADRRMSEGDTRAKAYLVAAKRMAWPIIASTLTTLAAFLPLVFWPGITGEFMKYLPITLLITLTASLFMALIFVPTAGKVIGRPRELQPDEIHNAQALVDNRFDDLKGLAGKYVRVLSWSLDNPWRVISGVLGVSALIILAYAQFGKGVEFFPNIEPEGANVIVHARGNLAIAEQDALVQDVEQRLFEVPGVENFYTRVGELGNGASEDAVGSIRVNLHDWDTRDAAKDIFATMRQNVKDLGGLNIEFSADKSGPHGGKPFYLELLGTNSESIRQAVDIVEAALIQSDAFQDIESSLPPPGIEWQFEIDRAEAAKLGADIALLGATVQLVTHGLKLTEYLPDDAEEPIDVRARFPEKDRHLGTVESLRVQTTGGQVPISYFANLVPAQRIKQLERVDAKRITWIQAEMQEGKLLQSALPTVKTLIEQSDWPSDVDYRLKGQDKDSREAEAFLQRAFVIALFIMAIILVTQFNSFYQASLILSAVVFSTVGVLLGLIIFQKPFGIVMSGIGVISLAGIVVNNNIVLIDTYKTLREKMSVRDAILHTGAERLRPVLLTTITTILGLLPMVFEVNLDLIGQDITIGGPSMQWWSQLASAVAGGLLFATVLTLIITPVLLKLGANLHNKMGTTQGQ